MSSQGLDELSTISNGSTGSKRSRREPFVTERSSLARAVNETPGLLVSCSYNRCLSHFHCLLNSLQLNLDGGHRTRRQLHCRSPAHAKIVAIDLRRSSEACAHAHLSVLTTVCDVEGDGPGHPMQGQVPLCWLLGTSVQEIGPIVRMEQAFLRK